MNRILAIFGLFTFFITHTNVVDQAVFQTPDGTQISLFGEEHNLAGAEDEVQVRSLLASIGKITSESDRRLHIMLEEPSQWKKSQQKYATVVSSLRRRLNLAKNKQVKAENAEIRCAAATAHFILAQDDPKLLSLHGKLDAKKPFASRKLSKWQSIQSVTFNDVYEEFEAAFDKIEKIRSVDPLREQLADFKQTYEKYANNSIYLVAQAVDSEVRYKMRSNLEKISNQLLDYYLLARMLQKSRTKDIVLIAGKHHIGALRGLLQQEACSLVAIKKNIEGDLNLDSYEFSRIKTAYLKFLRYYLKFKRMIVAKTKLLRSRL